MSVGDEAGDVDLVVDGPAPALLPACPLPRQERDERPLYVLQRSVVFRTRHGWMRTPRGYVTDFASIPVLATLASCLRLQPLGRWAWAALAHDWLYAIGEPGRRSLADDVFRERLALDGVAPIARTILYDAVRVGGGDGYLQAAKWWAGENFADPRTGAYPIGPPFPREAAFSGTTHGLKAAPVWPELSATADTAPGFSSAGRTPTRQPC